MYVIGTAGHVDHGKSTLVQALTGIDPDRLREEKERGLTIDLGFAWMTLPGGEEVSIVDVPGHERFIKNMLAGAGGIDLALLVIAADEGVMPQTREHLAILDLLGVEHGVVALTKTDLVETELLPLAEADARAALSGTTLANVPIVPCSAVTREGLPELVDAIARELARTPERRDIGRPRLPIDRVFTMPGFGTVVTGTLIDGSLRTGEEVEVLPARPGTRIPRIRGLQSHGRKVEVARPGRRTAINLSGTPVDALSRGMVVTTRGWLRPTDTVDVQLRAASYIERPIRHNLHVSFHTGAAEVEGRVLLLDREELSPGESGWAQIRLTEPVAAATGDRFVVRDPNDTLGGGRIVDTQAKRHKRHHSQTLAALETLARGSPEDIVVMAVARREPIETREVIAGIDLSTEDSQRAIERLVASGELCRLRAGLVTDSAFLYTKGGLRRLTDRMCDALVAYHKQSPLRPGMPREELRSRLGLLQRTFDAAVATWVDWEAVKDAGGAVALPSHKPSLDAELALSAGAYLAALRANPYAPAPETIPSDDVLAYLEARGDIVRTQDGVAFSSEAYREMLDLITTHIRTHGAITLAEVRDMFDTSRKYAQAFLQHLDAQRVTRRDGDRRMLRKQ